MLERQLLSLNHTKQPLLSSNIPSAASSPLSVFMELQRAGPCSGLGFGLRECCGWFDLLSRPLNISLSAIRLSYFLIICMFTGVALKIFFCPGWCSSVDWARTCEPKGRWSNSQSRHMPGFQARSSVRGTWEATTHCCFSLCLSPSLPLSLKINK